LNKHLIAIVKFLLFFSLGFTILYLLYKSQNEAYLEECAFKGIPESECVLLDKIIADFKSIKLIWVFVIVALFTLSNYLRAIRWQALLKVMGYSTKTFNAFGTVMLGYFANLGFPRLGEIVRPATLSKYENIPLEKNIGTIIVERLVDVVCLLICIGLAILLGGKTMVNYLQENSAITATQIFFLLGLGIFGGLAAIIIYRQLLKQNSTNKVFLFIKEKLTGIIDGLMTLLKLEHKVTYIIQTIGIWICYYLMTYLFFFAYAPTEHLGPVAGLVTFVFGSLGIVIPSPGGMGSYHFLISQALILYGVNSFEAFTFANILFFAIVIFCNILLGLLSLILLPILNK